GRHEGGGTGGAREQWDTAVGRFRGQAPEGGGAGNACPGRGCERAAVRGEPGGAGGGCGGAWGGGAGAGGVSGGGRWREWRGGGGGRRGGAGGGRRVLWWGVARGCWCGRVHGRGPVRHPRGGRSAGR